MPGPGSVPQPAWRGWGCGEGPGSGPGGPGEEEFATVRDVGRGPVQQGAAAWGQRRTWRGGAAKLIPSSHCVALLCRSAAALQVDDRPVGLGHPLALPRRDGDYCHSRLGPAPGSRRSRLRVSPGIAPGSPREWIQASTTGTLTTQDSLTRPPPHRNGAADPREPVPRPAHPPVASAAFRTAAGATARCRGGPHSGRAGSIPRTPSAGRCRRGSTTGAVRPEHRGIGIDQFGVLGAPADLGTFDRLEVHRGRPEVAADVGAGR